MGAKSHDQFDSIRRNAMFQFFNANVNVEKLCGKTSGDLKISMGDYKKIVEWASSRTSVSESYAH